MSGSEKKKGLKADITDIKAFIRTFPMILQDIERRLNAFSGLIIEKGIITEEEFEDKLDILRQIRKRMPEEKIEAGDICWVDYEVSVDGEKKSGQNGVPIRVGSKSAVFEPALLGKHPGEDVVFETVFSDSNYPEFFNKKTTFNIKIGKVKSKEEVKDGSRSEQSAPT